MKLTNRTIPCCGLLAILPLLASAASAQLSTEFGGETRLRFEHLDQQFRLSKTGSDQALLARTLIHGSVRSGSWQLAGEVIDSRELGAIADEDTTLGTSAIDPLDVLQFNLSYFSEDQFCAGCASQLTLGRFTLDLGSRRFVARNRYRNTINSFTGALWQLQTSEQSQWQLFYTHPVKRLFNDNALDNSPKLDEELNRSDFWGLYFATLINPTINAEWYLLGLNEETSASQNTAAQDLYTAVSRWYDESEDSWQWQLELAYQWGEVGSDTPSKEDKHAYFLHAELGKNLSANAGNLTALLDYASGDENADDDEDNTFDTLFGARRFDFGPTSLYGAFARSNLLSPGIRWTGPKAEIGQFDVTWRYFRLAESDDTWATAGLQPAQLSSDATELGQQLEGRWRWQNSAKTWLLEAGANYLLAGDLMQEAGKDDAVYVYSEVTFKF